MVLIKDVLVAGRGDEREDILLHEGKIRKIGKNLDCGACFEVIDASGLVAFPGIVDLNVRIQDDKLNLTNLEKLYAAAQKGGVSHFVLSPRTEPLIENQTFKSLLAGKLKEAFPNLQLAIKAIRDKEGTKLNSISAMVKNGIRIVQENSDINGNLLRRIYEYSKMHRNLFFVFCENKILNDSGVMNEGEVSFKLGLPGISKIGEISEVAKVAQMSMHYDVPTLFQALSTRRAVNLVYDAKKRFSQMYAEVSIHHLVLDERACDGFNTYAKLNPPLRTPEDREELIAKLQEGKIDILTALHSPKSVIYKDVAFAEAKYGIDAIEYYLPLAYTYLVKPKILSWKRLTELMAKNPAQILGLRYVGAIEEGYEANLILFDPKHREVVTDKNSPYFGRELYGKIVRTLFTNA
jgi:dihydroorotase